MSTMAILDSVAAQGLEAAAKAGKLARSTGEAAASAAAQGLGAAEKAAASAGHVAWKLARSTGKAAWIAGTSFLVLGVPLIIVMGIEGELNDLEAQQQALLGERFVA